MSQHKYIILNVTLAGREDGGLNVGSDELPGLILSGPDRDKIAAAIAPAIKALFEHRGFPNVTVHRGIPVADVLRAHESGAVSVRVEHHGVETEQFVVGVGALAA
jgi:hypothetical protein